VVNGKGFQEDVGEPGWSGKGAKLLGGKTPVRSDGSGEFLFALLWLVLVLSLAAVSLLYVLIRRGAAASVSSLFFLVPPCTALMAWPLFGERLGPAALLGMAVALAGVMLARSTR
jgi:drug/metabolite transporter (DMT)-like permease